MQLTDERRREIEAIVDSLLHPYETDLESFTLEKIREQYRIWLVGKTSRIPRRGRVSVFLVIDDYVIAFHKDEDITSELMAHELAHTVLGHPEVRKRYFESLSGYQRWERYVVRKEEPPFPWGDTPQENAEANHFSTYLCSKLQGIQWLKDTEIKDLDSL